MGLRWSGDRGFDDRGYLAGDVARYGAAFLGDGGGAYWLGFLVQEPLLDARGKKIRFGSEAEAKAAVDDEWLAREITDLDSGVRPD